MNIGKITIKTGRNYLMLGYPVLIAAVGVLDCVTMDNVGIVHILIYCFFFLCSVLTSVMLFIDKKRLNEDSLLTKMELELIDFKAETVGTDFSDFIPYEEREKGAPRFSEKGWQHDYQVMLDKELKNRKEAAKNRLLEKFGSINYKQIEQLINEKLQ